MENSVAKGMDEKIEAAAEMGGREEDMGAREMSKKMGDLSKGMDQKIEAAAEMGGREEDMGAREM
jgi:hypothetical protein